DPGTLVRTVLHDTQRSWWHGSRLGRRVRHSETACRLHLGRESPGWRHSVPSVSPGSQGGGRRGGLGSRDVTFTPTTENGAHWGGSTERPRTRAGDPGGRGRMPRPGARAGGTARGAIRLLLTDVLMPHMSGPELAKDLMRAHASGRTLAAHAPIVVTPRA